MAASVLSLLYAAITSFTLFFNIIGLGTLFLIIVFPIILLYLKKLLIEEYAFQKKKVFTIIVVIIAITAAAPIVSILILSTITDVSNALSINSPKQNILSVLSNTIQILLLTRGLAVFSLSILLLNKFRKFRKALKVASIALGFFGIHTVLVSFIGIFPRVLMIFPREFTMTLLNIYKFSLPFIFLILFSSLFWTFKCGSTKENKKTLIDTLYVSDLDGTLLNRDSRISEDSKDIIIKLMSKGMKFTIATARSWSSTSTLVEDMNLSLPVATYNGAFIIDSVSGKIIESSCLEKEQAEYALNVFLKAGINPLVYAFINGEERVSWVVGQESDGIKDYIKSRSSDKRLRPVSTLEDVFIGDIFYFTAIDTKEKLETLTPMFEGNKSFSYTFQKEIYKDEYWFEVKRFDATKAVAVEKIKKMSGCTRVICFGDSSNDLPMFSIADEAYAVCNADPVLIKAATQVIESADDNGVARWLSENLYIRDNNI